MRKRGEYPIGLHRSRVATQITDLPCVEYVGQGYIPTSPPSAPQISYTVSESHLPSFSVPIPHLLTAIIVAGGRNTLASSFTLYAQTIKNGSNHYSASANVAPNNYWTLLMYGFYDAVVGDRCEVKLWGSKTSFLEYRGMVVYPTALAHGAGIVSNITAGPGTEYGAFQGLSPVGEEIQSCMLLRNTSQGEHQTLEGRTVSDPLGMAVAKTGRSPGIAGVMYGDDSKGCSIWTLGTGYWRLVTYLPESVSYCPLSLRV